MAVTATDSWSLPFVGLAELIAACPTFRSRVGASSAAEALERIFYPSLNLEEFDDEAPLRNWAIITDDDTGEWTMNYHGWTTGSLLLTLQFRSSPDYAVDSKDALLDFTNACGAIFREAIGLRNTPKQDGSRYWNASEFTRVVAPYLCDEREHEGQNVAGDLYYETCVLVGYG